MFSFGGLRWDLIGSPAALSGWFNCDSLSVPNDLSKCNQHNIGSSGLCFGYIWKLGKAIPSNEKQRGEA
ncbi:hypothetical protein ACOSQ4_016895 [Xanthoceras sorbifolium]